MRKTAYILLLALGFSACNYLEIEPVGQVIPHKTSEFRALLTEGYRVFPYTTSRCYTGLLSDEVGIFHQAAFYSASDATALSYNYTWQYTPQMYEYSYQYYYKACFIANAIIEGIPTADKDSVEPADQILGEAHVLRAYAHFDLVNLYSKPYNPATAATDRSAPLSTYIDIEQKYRPSTVAATYKLILDDIAQAEQLMTLEKQTDNTLNYRFSLEALAAFKARVMLYMGAWQEALDASKSLLPKYTLVDLNKVTDKKLLPWVGTSPEAILAWERPFGGGGGDLKSASVLSEKIFALLPATDNRRNYIQEINTYDENWVPTLIGYGINRSSSDRTSIRVAEMYLIAAEAAAHLPAELVNAKKYLLDLQVNRLKPDVMEAQRTKVEAMDAEALLAEIADERARELLLEGHRWFDLRRTTQPEITKVFDGQTYRLQAGDPRYTLPFPQSAIDNNPELKN